MSSGELTRGTEGVPLEGSRSGFGGCVCRVVGCGGDCGLGPLGSGVGCVLSVCRLVV